MRALWFSYFLEGEFFVVAVSIKCLTAYFLAAATCFAMADTANLSLTMILNKNSRSLKVVFYLAIALFISLVLFGFWVGGTLYRMLPGPDIGLPT